MMRLVPALLLLLVTAASAQDGPGFGFAYEPTPDGLRVTALADDGPALPAGLRVDDVVMSGGNAAALRARNETSFAGLDNRGAQRAIGAVLASAMTPTQLGGSPLPVRFTVLRDGRTRTVEILPAPYNRAALAEKMRTAPDGPSGNEEDHTPAFDFSDMASGDQGLPAHERPSGGDDTPPPSADRSPDRVEQGRLEMGDETLSSGKYADVYTVRVPSGGRLIAEVESDGFDSYLAVASPSGEQTSNDDWEGSQSRSRVEIERPASGTWRVVVTSYESGETGAYTLSLWTDRPRTASDLSFAENLNQVLAAAPSFERLKGSRIDDGDRGILGTQYHSTLQMEGAEETRLSCSRDGCNLIAEYGRFTTEADARRLFTALVDRVHTARLEGGPYLRLDDNSAVWEGFQWVNRDGVAVSVRLIENGLAAAVGEPPYSLVLNVSVVR